MPTHIEVFKSKLSQALQDRWQLGGRLYRGNPKGAIDYLLNGGGVPPEQIESLNFIRNLLAYCLDNSLVCGGLLKLLELPRHEDLATLLFPTKRLQDKRQERPGDFPAELTDAVVNDVRLRFLDDQPLVIMLTVLRRGNFSLDQRPRLIADCLMTAMIRHKLNIDDADLFSKGKQLFANVEKEETRKQIDEVELKTALDFIRSVKILSSLVEDPDDVPRLYAQNYRTVRQITTQSKDAFTKQLVNIGMTQDNALKIHDFAEGVDCWNENLWLSLMEKRRENFEVFSQAGQAQVSGGNLKSKSSNNLTEILNLEEPTCAECCSVTSLSAYLADLLSLLSNVSPISDSLPEAERNKKPNERDNLLNILSRRRPDLRKLELTCANSQTLIPYANLVNEVLQSFIRFKSPPTASSTEKADSIQAFNNPADLDQDAMADEHGAALYRPGNIDHELFTKVISKQTYPFTAFPYNHARDMIVQYFAAFKCSYSEVVDTFGSSAFLLQRFIKLERGDLQAETLESLTRGARATQDRQAAAEVLNLQHFDYLAITGQSFFPQDFVDLLMGLSTGETSIVRRLTPNMIASLWGYTDENAMTDVSKGTGLSFIRDQLMKRSGLTFQDVLDLCQTQYFGQNLVITNASGSNEFSDRIGELRLLQIAPADANTKPDRVFKPLTRDMCRDIQAFVRLRAKIKWSIKDLDTAIYCLRQIEIAGSPEFKSFGVYDLPPISPEVVQSLASIARLSDLSDIEPSSLFALWGTIDSFGDNSLLQRLCSRIPPGVQSELPIDMAYFKAGSKRVTLRTAANTVCSMLRWPLEHLEPLIQATNMADAILDVENLSILYRHVVIIRLLEVPTKMCLEFIRIFFSKGQQDPLVNPKATLTSIQRWKLLLESGWATETVIKALEPINQQDENNQSRLNSALRLVSVLSQGAREMKKTLYTLFPETSATLENVFGCASHLFDGPTAKVITNFIEGTQICSVFVDMRQKTDVDKILAQKWPKKLSIIPSLDGSTYRVELKLTGSLTAMERRQMVATGEAGPSDFNSKLVDLVKESLLPRSILSKRFERDTEGKQRLSDSLLMQDWPEDTSTSASSSSDTDNVGSASVDKDALQAEKSAILREKQLQARRNAWIDLAKPTIVQDLITTLIIDTVHDILPDADPVLLSFLLSEIVVISAKDGTMTESAIMALRTLSLDDDGSISKGLDAYFVPTATNDFTLIFTGDLTALQGSKVPAMKINGLEIPFNNESNTWATFRMIGRQPNLLQCNLPTSQISWSTPRSMPTAFTKDALVPSTKVQYAARVYSAISRAVMICQTMQLNHVDLEYIKTPVRSAAKQSKVDLNQPDITDLKWLAHYNQLKIAAGTGTSGDHTVSQFLQWISQTPIVEASTIASKLAACTRWNEVLISNILSEKYKGYNKTELVTTLNDLGAILSINAIVRFYARLGSLSSLAAKPSISDLFGLAQPPSQLFGDSQYTEAAKALQSRLSASQRDESDEALTENQRKALVSYLLQQDYIQKDLKIWDADGLFEYFLMDVQMGPQIRTSRVKQAISVVQLFIQRCLLGMEQGVLKSALPRAKWDWMQQYTLWEAHRKILLYPENWIDPTLRDDKSPLFTQFEASLMQKNLSVETFSQAIHTYVFGLNEISSLDIVAYLHEPQKDADIFHFFGRNRTAPYAFYYRVMTIYRTGNETFWQPWTKIEMEIPSVETEWSGKRLESTGAYVLPVLTGKRLYLFLPTIMTKTVGSDVEVSNDDKFSDLGQRSINSAGPARIWEVTMGWTELVKNNWSPKRVSSGCLTTNSIASSSQFRFDPEFDGDTIKIQVAFSLAGTKKRTSIGTFTFREDQISAAAVVTGESDSLFSTDFQKVVNNGFDPDKLLPADTSTYPNSMALVWVPKDIDKTKKIAWTLSKTRQQVTGLVVTVQQSDGTKVSYFSIPKEPLYKSDPNRPWDKNGLRNQMELATLDHTFSNKLMQATSDRIDPLQSLYTYMAKIPYDSLRESFGAGSINAWYHELGRPSAIYNWEIGLHAVLLTVDRLFSTQQYEEALQIARLVFDPTIEQVMQTPNSENYQSCWRFPPFQDIARRLEKDGEKSFDPLDLTKLAKELELAIKERRSYPSLVHTVARGRPVAYMKWIMMKYAEILVLMGDVHFRTGRLEALPLATQRYIEATHVLGPTPPIQPDLAKRKKRAKTFEQLREADIMFDAFTTNIKLPFARQLQRGAATNVDADKKRERLRCFLRTDYFCTPLNPRFKQMRDLVHERLYNLRNSLDINGKPVVYALREPPIDPGALMSLSGQGNSISDVMAMVMSELDGPLPRQRFDVLMQTALDLCGGVRVLGERLVTAVEKKEAETFSLVQARNGVAIQQMMHEIKKVQLDEANMMIEALAMSRSSADAQLKYYLKLIGEPESKVPKPNDDWFDVEQSIDEPTKDDLKMTSHEKLEMDLAVAATVTATIAAGIDGIAAPLAAIPQVEVYTAPLGIGASTSMGGSQLSSALAFSSVALKMATSIVQDEGSRAGRKAALARQLQERRLQANIAGREIKSIDKQISIQQVRVRSIQKEIDQAKAEWNNAIQMEQWYKSKYTNEQLYSWMEKSIRNLYYQAYTLALTMARRAEAAFAFDAGRKIQILRPEGYWDASHSGLLAADYLYLDLKRLEAAQVDNDSSDFEITKTVSLREIDPMALFRLRVMGSCEFTVGELLYDADFPGHYMRRIKSVSMTVPAVTGPHSGVNATLTLLSHKYRVSRSAATGKDYIAGQSAGSEAFRFDRLPSTSIAISSGMADPGVFELSFSGSSYMPFEGAGAISTWRLELPPTIRKFDFESISDVLLHVRYTAFNGGAMLKAAANDAVLLAAQSVERKGQGFWALWDLKNEFANEWNGFSTGLLTQKKLGSDEQVAMNLGDVKSRLPFFARQAKIQVRTVLLVSLDQQLIENLKLSVMDDAPSGDGSTIGGYSIRTFKDMKIAKLNEWSISTTRAALEEKVKDVANVFMVLQYTFAGKATV